ncbi:MAG: hypothetical protein ACJ04P_01565 [Halioglobus sp.]
MDNMTINEEPAKTPPPAPANSRAMRLTKLASTHVLVFVVALSLFAAADSWSTVTGLGIATVLCVVTGALAGITITTLVHEWFHYLGARYSGAAYDIPEKQGLFLYNWDFTHNSVRQFLMMSVAGSVGGILALSILWTSVPADSWGRAALQGGAIASVVFAAYIEWPVIRRVRISRDPLAQMSKIDLRVLSRSFAVSSIAGVFVALVLVA